MSEDDALWAERLLVDARASAEPTEQDAARNLAGVEQRLQLGVPAGEGAPRAGDGAAASAGTLLELRPGAGASRTIAAARATSAGSAWKSPAVLGRWLLFGVTTALLGYLGGRAQSRQELAELERAPPAQQGQLAPLQEQELALAHGRQPPQPQPAPALLEQPLLPAPPVREQPRPDATAPFPARPFPARPFPARPSPPRPSPARPRAAPPRAAAHRQAPPQQQRGSAPNQQLREAIELLQRAEATLRQGDAFAASLLLSDLERTAPAHLLREERLVTRALVSCALADAPSASAALQELEQQNPQSIYRARLEGSCAEKKLVLLPKEAPAPH